MQDWAMTVDRFIEHAARWHPAGEIVSRLESGAIERRTYAELRDHAARLSHFLQARGIAEGDRVATLAMNGGGHLAAWYGICGIGAVCHTLNPRMSEDQLAWIAAHAGDRLLIADGAFASLAERLRQRCPSIEEVFYLSPPQGGRAGKLLASEIAGFAPDCIWGGFHESAAAGLCYTSGTTGDPKGVLYSHRSNVLHTLFTIQPDMFGLSAHDVIMPVVPMYHANAWGLAFSAPCVGAKLVMPGAALDGESLCALIAQEGVTFSAGVPTVWGSVLDHMQKTGTKLPSLRRVIVGGAALPERVLHAFDERGIEAIHAWGMTELSPVGGVGTLVPALMRQPPEARLATRLKQGRVPFGVDMRVVGEDGMELMRDGQTPGALQMRGPATARGYFGQSEDRLTQQGFFDTGDIATIDVHGYVKITDRAKDIIKSGGEWISSAAMEEAALSFPGVALAAVIGVPHPRWDERPVLYIVLQPGLPADSHALAAHLAARLPKWWLPETVHVVQELPLGPTGKIDKKQLRAKALADAESSDQ
jgi:fatty-acyl-CoA synthase